MNGRNFLTSTLIFSIMTMTGCGDSQKNSAVDHHNPTTIQRNSPPNTQITDHQSVTTRFTPRERSLIQGSTVHLSEQVRIGSPYVSEGYSVHPLDQEQQAKVQLMLKKTNDYRRQNGLPPLKYDADLSAYAYVRADENREKYSHTRPNGDEFHTGLTPNGLRGENLNASRKSVEDAFSSWVDSKGHKRNILEERFTRIGIAYIYDPNSKYKYYWVQTFADDKVASLYHFDPKMAEVRMPEIEQHLESKIKLQNGKISLSGGKSLATDNAAKAYQARQLTNPIYRTTRQYANNGYEAIIQEPAGVFSYQTFGEVVDPNREPVQYLNIGQPTIPEPNANFQATYHGASIGHLNNKSHVYADVVADVDFRGKKTMDLRFSNSKIAHGDIASRHAGQSLSRASELDFSEKLQWNAQEGRFTGHTATANFYGPQGEEIGGQFSRQVSEGHYQGAFGLKKVTR